MPFRIALVDDDRDFTMLVAELLRQQGWEVAACNVEEEAVACVSEPPADLAILDIRMSRRASGWNILEQLQENPATRDIRVIVCSAATDDLQRRAEWMHSRGIAPLPKPFDIDDLLQLVERMLPDQAANGPSHHVGTNGDKQST